MGRAARKPVVEANSDSDDGAPEEVNMSAGKHEAERLRREERESQQRVLAAAKEKRKKASGPKEEKAKKKKHKAAQLAAAADELDADEDEEALDQQRGSRAVTHGLLDESIVKFLAAQEKKVVEIENSLPEEVERRKPKEKKKKKSADTSSSRVKVVVLKNVQPKTASFHNAMEFRRNRLFGEDVHRSLVMLPKKVR